MEIRISDELNDIIRYARDEAMRTGSYGIGPDHLFLGVLRHGDNAAFRTVTGLGIDADNFKRFIDSHIFTNEPIPYAESDKISFTRYAQNVLSITVLEASKQGVTEANSLHLLLALCRTTENYGQAYLRQHGVDYGRLLSYMRDEGMLGKDPEQEDDKSEDDQQETNQESKPEKSVIEDFGFDLTKAAAEGKLDPVVGRETEIARVIEILGRRKKNNPMLIGEPIEDSRWKHIPGLGQETPDFLGYSLGCRRNEIPRGFREAPQIDNQGGKLKPGHNPVY